MAGRVEISREDVAVIAENLMDEAKPPIEVPPEDAAPRSPTETPIPDQLVISFVKELDRAQQHFELVENIFRIMKRQIPAEAYQLAFYLHTFNQEHHTLPLLCLSDFYHYFKAYVVARNEHRDPIHTRASFYKKEAYICSGPVFDLLFQARHYGYILDEDPRVELRKLHEYTPYIYDSLVRQEPPVDRQARTVIVSNLSDEVCGEDIWRLFWTCGVAEHVEMKSELDGQVAEITFKEVRSAKFAAEFSIYPALGREFQQHEDLPLVVKLKTAADVVKKAEETAVDVVKKVEETATDVVEGAEVSNMYTKAMDVVKKAEETAADVVKKAEETAADVVEGAEVSNMYTKAMVTYRGIQVLYENTPVQ